MKYQEKGDRFRVFGNDKIIKIDDWYWTSEDVPAYEYLKDSHSNELECILPHLTGNKVAVQAGGHCGFAARELLPYFETIYTFEPDNTMFTCLCLNVPEINVYKMQACLGATHKLVSMSGNPICPHAGAKYVKGGGAIPMLMIDDLALKACSLIMVDLEGYELEALNGAADTIDKYHPLLCIERYWANRTLKSVNLSTPEQQMDKFLEIYNYELVARTGENNQDCIYKYKGE